MSFADQQWCPTSAQVTVLQARGLRIKGKSGTNDAYAVMQVGKEKYQTSVAEKSVAPVWREEATFDLPQGGGGGGGGGGKGTLHVHVLHRALVGPDKQLGQAVVDLLRLSEDKTRNKTEWFKLVDKTGKADKDRGEVLLDIQFMRNHMTASMFDLSAAGKSRSRLGKFKDKVRGKKKEPDAVSGVVPSFTQVLTDSEEEARDEDAAGKDEKKKKHKMKSLFSAKSNLQRNMSQSMSVLPAKTSSLSRSQSSGLNVDSSEGKKKFKFMIHKRLSSSDGKDSSGQTKHGGVGEQSNLCINGSHVYCDGSNFSLTSSGHGSMEDVPESSPPSVSSLNAARQYSPWTEEEEEEEKEEEEETAEVENIMEDVDEERISMEKRREEEVNRTKEDRVRREEEERERLAVEKRRMEEQERQKLEEERRRLEEEQQLAEEKRRKEEEKQAEEERRQEEEEIIFREEERMRQEEERERERLAEEKRRLEEQERKRIEEEMQREEEERIRMDEERRQEEERERERLEEEKRRLEEQERKRIEKEMQREEEERIRMDEERRQEEERERERLEEEKRRLEEQERKRMEEERIRVDEEKRQKEHKLAEENRQIEKRAEEEERVRRLEEEEREMKRILDEQERRWQEEQEKNRKEEEKRLEEEERARKEKEEYERFVREVKERERIEAEEKIKKEVEDRIKMEEEVKREEKKRLEEEEKKRLEEQERRRREEEERRRREEEQRRREEEQKRREEEEKRREEEEKRREEEEKRREIKKEELERLAEEKRRVEEQESRWKEEERIRKEEQEKMRIEAERKRRREEEEMERLAEEKRRREEQEKLRTEEEETQREEEQRFRRVEEEEEEARKLMNKRTEEQKNQSKVTSTNPFDENVPPEDVPRSPTGADVGCQSAVSLVEGKSVSTDDKNVVNAQREKRHAPPPPGSNIAASRKEQDVASQHLAQNNKQSNDKDVKTASVLPQRSLLLIAPQSQSRTDAKITQNLAHSTASGGKCTKRPAPSRPGAAEEEPPSASVRVLSSNGKTSQGGGSKRKPGPVVRGLNPFEDDEDELTLQDHTTNPGDTSPILWPPPLSQATAEAKPKSSSKTSHAPPPPASKRANASTLIHQNSDGCRVTTTPAVSAPDNDANRACGPQPEATLSARNTSLKDPQPAEVTGVKKEAPPTSSRRLLPVRPLNPLEQQSVSIGQEGKSDKSTGILSDVQEKTKITDDSGLKGPYSQLTREELVSLVLKQENQMSERDKKISEMEQYIDNLLVRVIEEQPSILMSMNSLK